MSVDTQEREGFVVNICRWLLQRSETRNIFNIIIIAVFMLTQLFDGISTYTIIIFYGGIELNPAVAGLMSMIGVGPAILIFKLAAIGGAIFLFSVGAFHALVMVTIPYVFLALFEVYQLSKI